MAAGARSRAAIRTAATSSGTSAMRRTRLMLRTPRKTSPATRTGRSSRRARTGATSQRRTITTVVIVARARPPYSPVGPGSMSNSVVENRRFSPVAPTARIATATRSTWEVNRPLG